MQLQEGHLGGMSNFKNIPDSNFTIVRNEMLYNDQLSLKAKGLLAVMRSFPPDWVYRQSHLLKLSTDGRDSMRAGLKELLDYGYVRRTQTRNPDGTLAEAEYHVTDAEPTVDGKPDDGYPDDGQAEATNTHITKTKKTNQNPSSTFVDVSASKPTSSTRNEAESPSSLKGVDLAASSARAHANKETSPASQVAAVIEIWNSNCGLARKTRKPTEKLERQVGAYIRAMKKNGDDPVAVMAFMAAEVAREGFYDRKYGLGNLLAGTNWEPRYQAYLESLETGTHSLAVGQRVSWLSNPSMPFSRRYYGHVSKLLEGGAVAIQAEPNQPGLHYNPSNMNPERLTVEDE